MNGLSHKSLIAILLICLIAMLLPMHIREQLYFHVPLIKQGEYWRFFTGHFIHYSWTHWASNSIGLLILISIFNNKHSLKWLLPSVFVLITVSSGLLLFSQQLTWYVGFSGILTGLFVYACIATITENKVLSILMLLIVLVYVASQLLRGELVDSSALTIIKTSSYAHAYGLLGGLISGLIAKFKSDIFYSAY